MAPSASVGYPCCPLHSVASLENNLLLKHNLLLPVGSPCPRFYSTMLFYPHSNLPSNWHIQRRSRMAWKWLHNLFDRGTLSRASCSTMPSCPHSNQFANWQIHLRNCMDQLVLGARPA